MATGLQSAKDRIQIPELLHKIFFLLPPKHLVNAMSVSRGWFQLAVKHLWVSASVVDLLSIAESGRYLLGRRVRDSIAPVRADPHLAIKPILIHATARLRTSAHQFGGAAVANLHGPHRHLGILGGYVPLKAHYSTTLPV